jgi:translation initiation factor IF-2
MNNSKVRIYELSRELNLENKDLLAICEQLNIAVKSHSSTISESEAERIRTAAEKYVPSVSPHLMSSTRQPSHSRPNPTTPQPVKSPPKAQQILEVRRHQPSADSASHPPVSKPPRPPAESTHNGAQSVTPNRPARSPAPPVRPGAATSEGRELGAETKPIDAAAKLAPSKSTVKPEVSRPEIGKPESSSVVTPKSTESSRPVNSRAELTKPEPPRAESAKSSGAPKVKLELVAPPSKPAPVEESQPALLHKPLLKRAKVDSDPRTEQPRRSVVQSPTGATSDRTATAPRREVPELNPPQRLRPGPSLEVGRQVAQKSAKGADGSSDSGTDAIEVLENLSLSKLIPSRGKRVKDRQDEEEETLDEGASGKAGNKPATKLKRRPQLKVDEDEDEEFNLDSNAEAAVDVSQSLVRPPKPKSAKQTKPAAVATTRISSQKTGRKSSRGRDRRQQEVAPERPNKLVLMGDLTVQELAAKLAIPESEVIKVLFFKGIAATINQMLDVETATMVAQELGLEVETAEAESAARKITEMLEADDLENLQRRPPVVTIMGHVDHGKTTLLDSIRRTKVAQGEAGGITQHIGAYHVDVEHDGQMQQVVFLDTPGHEAFTAMRARGARVTDIAVLVVAADDGVRPQTVEAISHAKAAEVPIVVAINKVDKESAQPDRVKQELTEYGLVAEEWGGDTIMVPVSAINRENLDTLLEMLLLVSEVEDLYANPDRSAKGTVIEANLDKARGPVATLLVQNGTLRVGDIIVAGSALGKVRAMIDDRGQRVNVASPSFAVEVLGLGDVPAAGDEFEVFTDEKEARAIADERASQQRLSRLQQAMSSRRVSLNALSEQAREGDLKELNLILKADVQGSVEAIQGALAQLPQNEVQLRVLYAAPGEISETDVDLAAASSAVVIGFNTTLASGARQAADRAGVDVRDYNIIYKLLDDVQGAMEGLLEPEMVEEPLGQAQVRAVFPVGKGSVAGCYVQNGKLIRNCKVRILRGGEVIHSGSLNSLKRIKEDAREVNAGYECGIRLDDFQDWTEGDIIDAFQMVSKRRTLSPA